MHPPHPVQDDNFPAWWKVQDEEKVCFVGGGEEGEEEVQEEGEEGAQLLGSSIDRPLLSPPAHGYPDDEDGLPRPEFVLIEQGGYFIDRDNATTAECDAGPGLEGRFKVTFCTAPPPLVSYFCVHATAYTHKDFVKDPLIVASETDGGLVLLRFNIGKLISDFFRPCCHHLFVYNSGTHGSRPSLKHLPHPGDFFGGMYAFNTASLAIVRDCNRKKEGKEQGNNPARSRGDNSGGANYRGPTLRPRHTLRPPRSYSSMDNQHSAFTLKPHTPMVLQPHSAFALHPHRGSGAFALHPHSGSGAFALHAHSGSGAFTLRPHTARASEQEHDCSECDYVIVARDCDFGYQSPSYLCLYHSGKKCWDCKIVDVPTTYHGHRTTKTLTIGEEVAWFDLSRNVIFCDVLADNPTIRFVGLPPPINEVTDPRTVRDVAVVGGYINCVEVHHQINEGIIKGWMAAKWSMKITGHSEEWQMDHKVCSSNISSRSFKLLGDTTAQPNFRKIHLGLPNMSVGDTNLVYFLAKIEFWNSEQTAWVVSIDLKNNAIHEAVKYNAIKTIGFSFGYGASRISKYLRVGKHGGHHGAVTGDGVRLQRHCGEDPFGVHGEHGGQPGDVMEQVRPGGAGQHQGHARAGGVALRGRKRRRS